MKGIDVSKHQGKIDWKKVANSGVEFAIIRAGYGKYKTQEDLYFKQNITGASDAGLLVGVYWYSYATSSLDANEEAKVCLDIIKPYKDKITLPVFFDQEYEPGIKASSKEGRTTFCNTFIQAIQAAGYESGLYCSADWIKNMVGDVKGNKWIAQYASKCTYTGNDLWGWQYTSKGEVPGISGNVDMDLGYFPRSNVDLTGWKKNGDLWYYYESGKKVKSAWRQIKDKWYYFGSNGQMLKGHQSINGKHYYLNEKAYAGQPEGSLWVTDSSGALTQK